MNVKKLRVLVVRFDQRMEVWQTPAFRAAIIEKVGRKHVAFSHHVSDEELLYRYPLIQYKTIQNQPAIVCLGDGVEEIHKFFQKQSWTIEIGEETMDLKIEKLDLNSFTLNVWEKEFTYTIRSWIGLNSNNLKQFNSMTNESDKLSFLERILIGNILSFAKGVEWTVDKPIKVHIRKIDNQRMVPYKENRMLNFDLEFTTNVFLPAFIGLGKGSSRGFGVIKPIRTISYEHS
ncbi:CRISPR-associated endonuclease Cas6 [Flavihumibacter profundi]|uniref:CRISPR-associated endonuclease Cas6 n=1 Tax=Flavihumibacter profundi TaxID=2716883 RepID=UPI001CC4F158|nr:CRISPR-associated endonuclease Cas6 [Flavihumibacter profundi]MBZ5857559.1 hypothetical protein [Flavihumibacter profundi]